MPNRRTCRKSGPGTTWKNKSFPFVFALCLSSSERQLVTLPLSEKIKMAPFSGKRQAPEILIPPSKKALSQYIGQLRDT